jgi:lysophospholipase L1-like esterase
MPASMAPDPGSVRFSRRRTLLYSCVLVLTTLGLIEGALRLVGVRRPPRPRILLRALDVDIDFPFMRPDSELFWAPRPGWTGEFLGKRVSINSLGLRGPEPGRQAGRMRLATFGDSITFGYGVSDEETYAHRLGALLDERGVDTINAGVTGFTSHQVLALVRRLVPQLDLDVATICIGWNDGTRRPLDDRQFSRRLQSSMAVDETLEHLYLYRAMKGLYLKSARWEEASSQDKPRVALDQYRENLAEIVRVCRASRVEPVFIALPRRRLAGEARPDAPYARALGEVSRELRVPLLDAGPLGLETPLDDNARFFIDTLHFSDEGNAVMAAEIARQIVALPPLAR